MSNQIKLDQQYQIFTAQSMGGNLVSSTYDVRLMEGYCVQFVWSGGGIPSGTVKIQASVNGTDFTDVDDSELSVAGNSGDIMINVDDHHYSYIKFVYTRTSGTATMNAWANFRTRS